MNLAKEQKLINKQLKASKKARLKRMKQDGSLTPEDIKYNRKKAFWGFAFPLFRFFILFGLCFVILYPIIFMLSTAFRPSQQMSDPSVVWIPKSLTLSNIKDVWEVMDFTGSMLNTLELNIISSLLSLITCSLTGYGFARFKFKGKEFLFAIVIFMIIVPPQITTIPIFLQYTYFDLFKIPTLLTGDCINLIDSPITMYAPALFGCGIRSGLFIFIFCQFFKGLPKELEDAAYLDGCNPFRTYIQIIIPNAKSSFLTVFLFSIVWYWNDYYISSSFFTKSTTVALQLKNLNITLSQQLFDGASVSTRQIIVWLEAGCLISILPLLIMYIFLQKYFVEGIERSGLGGA